MLLVEPPMPDDKTHDSELIGNNHCKVINDIWYEVRSRDSVVDIATGYGLDDQGIGVRVTNLLFSMSSRPALRPTQPHIQWVLAVLSWG
jgi:hypothetical protein